MLATSVPKTRLSRQEEFFRSALSERTLQYLQPYAAVSALLAASSQTDLILLLALLTYCFYPSACHNAVDTLAEKLIAPFWHRVHKRRPALVMDSDDGNLSSSHWLCGDLQNVRCRRQCRSMQVTHNRAPPQPLSYSAY